ncbi:MAG: AEC family transporter [Victivallales bacterium]|nr:AEC family transporter [Victivallales bacterium]
MVGVTIATLAPIFLIIVLGWLLQTKRLLPEGFFTGMNTLVFYFGLPSLLFLKIATSPLEPGPALRIFLAMMSATAVVLLTAYAAAPFLRLDKPGTAAFAQASIRGNLAYIGLPLIFFSAEGSDAAEVSATAALVLAPVVPAYNLVCVLILSHLGNKARRPTPFSILLKILGNPLMIACIAGLAAVLLKVKIPLVMSRTLEPLGQMALPLALLSIGSSFTRRGVYKHVLPAFGASALKVLLAPLLGLVFARIFHLSAIETMVALIFLACPTAVTSYIMADQMGADTDLAGGAVALSTMLCSIPLFIILLSAAWQ